MAVTYTDASNAIHETLRMYGVHLPRGLADQIRRKGVHRIYQILPAAAYRPMFDVYYRNFFAAINAQAFGTKFAIGVAKAPDPVCGTFNCPAFCAPAVNPLDRMIYVNQDEGLTAGTLYHEFVHYISHSNFYPEFYSMGGENPKILEGVTEYLTRNISSRVEYDRSSQNKYQDWFDAVVQAMADGGLGELDMIRFALKGEYVNLPKLDGVPPRL